MERRGNRLSAGLFLGKSDVDVQDILTSVVPLHEVENLQRVTSLDANARKERKGRHLFQDACSETQPVECTERVPLSAFKLFSHERFSSVKVSVIFDSEQDKVGLV